MGGERAVQAAHEADGNGGCVVAGLSRLELAGDGADGACAHVCRADDGDVVGGRTHASIGRVSASACDEVGGVDVGAVSGGCFGHGDRLLWLVVCVSYSLTNFGLWHKGFR